MESEVEQPVVKRGRGRPVGSKNRPLVEKLTGPETQLPPASSPMEDYRHADPAVIIERQISMLDMAQQMVREEMKTSLKDKNAELWPKQVEKLERLSNGILRIIEALKKHGDLAEEMAKRMSPEQLFEAAIKKIEGQDLATLNSVIKRLRIKRAAIAPIGGLDKMQMGEIKSAAAAIAELENE